MSPNFGRTGWSPTCFTAATPAESVAAAEAATGIAGAGTGICCGTSSKVAVGGGIAALGPDSTLGYATMSPAAFLATGCGQLPPGAAFGTDSATSAATAGTISVDNAGCKLGVGCVELGGDDNVSGPKVSASSTRSNMSKAGVGRNGYGSNSSDHLARATGASADRIPLESLG